MTKSKQQPTFLTLTQVAELCGVNRKSVHDWVVSSKFPGAFRVPGGAHTPWLIPEDEALALKKERDQAAT